MRILEIPALLFVALRDFMRNRCTHIAAGIAYYFLLSIFPLAIVAVSVIGMLLTQGQRQDFIDGVIAQLPLKAIGIAGQDPGTVTELERNLRNAMEEVQGLTPLTFIALAGTLWASSGVFGSLRSGLDVAWNVQERRRNFIKGKLVDLAMMAVLGVLFAASLMLTAMVSIARNAADFGPLTAELAGVWQVTGTAISTSLTFIGLVLLYRYVPDTDQSRLRTVWPGALLAAIGIEALKFGLSVYVENFGSYNQVYGTLGAVVIFLFWAWLSAVIILFGAEVTAEYSRRHASHRKASAPLLAVH